MLVVYIYIIHKIFSRSSSSFYLGVSNAMSFLFLNPIYGTGRAGSRAAAASKMEHFVMIVNGWKRFVLDDGAALDSPPTGLFLHSLKTLENVGKRQPCLQVS